MDESVLRAMLKWPDVPAVYGWLELDRRGQWRIRGERIGNEALRDFIARNYASDDKGRWYFQNGPQRVFVKLAYAPLVVRHEADRMVDHCGRPFFPLETWLDEEGSNLFRGRAGLALLDDRDLDRYEEQAERLPRITSSEAPARFGFDPDPKP